VSGQVKVRSRGWTSGRRCWEMIGWRVYFVIFICHWCGGSRMLLLTIDCFFVSVVPLGVGDRCSIGEASHKCISTLK